ncbi:MAG: homocysteine S-methyltransferase family protein [Halomonas sp.]|nr:homocysteine S-methyltransferase family protein [Halomonas sp.]
MRWVERGATLVGGCCEVGPEHIATLAERLTARGYQLVSS